MSRNLHVAQYLYSITGLLNVAGAAGPAAATGFPFTGGAGLASLRFAALATCRVGFILCLCGQLPQAAVAMSRSNPPINFAVASGVIRGSIQRMK